MNLRFPSLLQAAVLSGLVAACSSPNGSVSDKDDDGAGGTANVGGSGNAGSTSDPNDPCADMMIDGFESPISPNYWSIVNDGTGTQTPSPGVTFTPEKDGQSNVLHTTGSGFTDFGASVGFPTGISNLCKVDFNAMKGIRFRAKGSKQFNVIVNVKATVPPSDGGTCTAGCWDLPRKTIDLTPDWKEHQVLWADLKQEGFGTPVVFGNLKDLNQDVLGIRFQFTKDQMPFDAWFDDIKGIAGSSVTCAPPAEGIVISECEFEAMFPSRNSFYTYAGFVQALNEYPGFANSNDKSVNRREAAAFLANVAHETGKLKYVDEENPGSNYCEARGDFPCRAGKSYHGRGPLQISWNYNYGPASQALGLNSKLLDEPETVSKNPAIAWETAMWFWTTRGCHDAIVKGQGFGQTIRLINGSECDGKNASAVEQRKSYYQAFLTLLGVDAGPGSLTC